MSQHSFRYVITLPWTLALVTIASTTASAEATEIQFSSLNTVEGSFADAYRVVAADLDGDGDLDLLGSAQSDDDVTWWENTAGDGSAWTRHDLNLDVNFPRGVVAGDLDGDGDADVVGAAFADHEILWWENDLGSGAACGMDFCERTVDSFAFTADALALADFDRDGDLDIVGLLRDADNVNWYENVAGDASTWTEHLIDGAFEGGQTVAVADLDGDGDADFLGGTGEGGGELSWYENNLDGAGPCATDWCEHSLDTGNTNGVAVADIDGDGDFDLLRGEGGSGLRWWENSAGDGTVWSEHATPIAVSSLGAVNAVDLDLDGDVDVLQGGDSVDWYENTSGDGSTWSERFVGPADALSEVLGADLDGDGDLDLVEASAGDDLIGWRENETLHSSVVFPVEHPIADPPFVAPSSAQVIDMDGDGDQDIVGGSLDSSGLFFDAVSWWSNDAGDGSDWTEQVVSDDEEGVRSVFAVDVDSDGDADILAAIQNSNEIVWWENDGAPCGGICSWSRHVIDSSFSVAQDVHAADVDGDGDIDVLGAANTDGVSWWENDGTASRLAGTWTEHVIDDTLGAGKSVTTADLDGDGDLDVLATDSLGDEVLWWENDGSVCAPACSWDVHLVAGVESAWSTVGADMDGDGDADVLVASVAPGSQGQVAWWENNGTCGPVCAWPKHSVAEPFDRATSVFAADLDQDGDHDVLATRDDKIFRWENTGPCAGAGGACDDWVETSITGDFGNTESVSAGDVDGDGDLDILAVARGSITGQFSWWPNRGGQFALPTADAVTSATPNEGASNVLALQIDGEHRGLAGEAAAELATIQLLFEESPGDPLTNQEFSDLIDLPRFYLDDGDGAFEPGADDLELGLGAPLFANDGLLAATFINGDPSVEIALGTPVSWWVALDLQPGAGTAVADSFIVSHLTESTSRGEVAGTDISLKLEYSVKVSSAPIAVNGAPFVATPIPDRSYGVGGAVSFDLAPFFDDPELDALDFSATGLPASLTLSPSGLVIGIPAVEDLAGSPYTVTVTAADPSGLEAEDMFELAILVAEIFADGFESGDTSAWSTAVP